MSTLDTPDNRRKKGGRQVARPNRPWTQTGLASRHAYNAAGVMLTRADMKELGSTDNNSDDGEYDAKRDAALSYDVAIAEMRRRKEWRDKLTAAKRVEFIGNCMMVQGDCLEVMQQIGNVDVVVTSPPYAEQRTYRSNKATSWIETISSLKSVNGDNAQILVNLGLVHKDGAVFRYWDPFFDEMESSGWRLFSWYIWDQCSGMAGSFGGRLAPSFEFVFHFNKIARRVNKTKPTLGGKIHGPNYRNKKDEQTPKSHNGRSVQPVKIPDNVIRLPRETSPEYSEHPARFPIKLAIELIEPFSDIGDLIIDPFMGSGTTGVACVKTGRHFIGIELDPDYFEIACRRVREAYAQPDLLIDAPKAAPQVQEAFEL